MKVNKKLTLLGMACLYITMGYGQGTPFFEKGLQGQIIDLPSESLPLKKIATKRAQVWKEWKRAVTNHYGATLAAEAITTATDESWPLEGEDPLPFVFQAKGGKPKEGYPLFINLHGSGPKKMEWKSTKELSAQYQDGPSLYFIPQIPNEERYRWGLIPMQLAYEKLLRLSMISDQINRNKIYIIGISEGGYGSQRLGAFYADYWAGVGPMAGGEPLDNAPLFNFRNTAFAMETGEYDTSFGRNIYTQHALSGFTQLKSVFPADFDHRIHIQPNRGHSIDYSLVTPWLVQKVRKTDPTHITWTNFPLYGRYRQGFANLSVEEEFLIHPDSSIDRVILDLVIDKEKNTLTLLANLWDKEAKKALPPQKGKLAIYLNESQLDLSKPVLLHVNGKTYYKGMVAIDNRNLWNSCLLFGDPDRLYPSKLVVDFSNI